MIKPTYLLHVVNSCLLHVVLSFLKATARSGRDPRVGASTEGEAAHSRELAGPSAQDEGDARGGHRSQGEQPHDRRQILYGHAQGDADGSEGWPDLHYAAGDVLTSRRRCCC